MPEVYFTKNMTPENRAAGLAALDIFFKNSVFKSLPYSVFTSLQGLINYLDSKYPTYIEFLGETARSITKDQLLQAMLNVARNGKTAYPRPADFSNGIIASVGSLRSNIQTAMRIVTETAKETAVDITNIGLTSIKYLPYALGAFALIFLLSKSGAGSLAGDFYRSRKRSNPTKRRKK